MYTRENPSPEYLAMVRLYESMHAEGGQSAGKSVKDTFPGKMLINHAADIRDMIEHTAALNILDYGAGKGLAYEQTDVSISPGLAVDSIQSYWGVDDIRCYDPGYAPFSALPDQQYDGVISTDVLEHITEPDVPWIIEEMFSYARKFVFANVACFPAVKSLPNGQNAHCTLHPPEWWAGLVHGIAMRHTDISYRLVMTTKTGARKKMGFSNKRRTVSHTVERLV